jgi:hypothetical protein
MLEGLSDDAATTKALFLRKREEYRYLGGEKGTFRADDAYEGALTEKEQWLVLQVPQMRPTTSKRALIKSPTAAELC